MAERRTTRRCLAAACVLGLGLLWPTPSQAKDVPAVQQAVIAARALAYDRNLASRADGEVRLAVLIRRGDPKSEVMGKSMVAAFHRLEGKRIAGMPFKAELIEYGGPGALTSAIADRDIDALYVSEGLANSVTEIRGLARKQKVTTIAANERYVHAGLCLGIYFEGEKPKIFVNLDAAEAEGAEFAAALLRLAKLVR